MSEHPQVDYRWKVSQGFLAETRQDISLKRSDYGDEIGGRTPWELFDETDALEALKMAEEVIELAQSVIQEVQDL